MKRTFSSIKRDIQGSVVKVIESICFEVEADALEVAVAVVLIQKGWPVMFFSRILQGPEK